MNGEGSIWSTCEYEEAVTWKVNQNHILYRHRIWIITLISLIDMTFANAKELL